jgi:ligand-binding sensor domain-containing protein
VQDGLAGDSVFCVIAAPDNSVWFGTDKGISHFNGKSWETFGSGNGLANNWITSSVIESNGTIWFGSASAIYRYQPSK